MSFVCSSFRVMADICELEGSELDVMDGRKS